MVIGVHFIPKAAIFYVPDWTLFLATRGVGFHAKHANSQGSGRACLSKATAASLLKALFLLPKETGSKLSRCPNPHVGLSVTPHCTEPWKSIESGTQVFR